MEKIISNINKFQSVFAGFAGVLLERFLNIDPSQTLLQNRDMNTLIAMGGTCLASAFLSNALQPYNKYDGVKTMLFNNLPYFVGAAIGFVLADPNTNMNDFLISTTSAYVASMALTALIIRPIN